MSRRRILIVTVAVALPTFGHVSAHDPIASRPVVGHVAAGATAPRGEADDFFHSGWRVSGGATFHASPAIPLGMRLDLGISRFYPLKQTVATGTSPTLAQIEDGSLVLTHLMFDAIWEFGGHGRVGGWLGAGVGAVHRHLEVTGRFPAGSCNDVIDPGSCLVNLAKPFETEDQLTKIGFDVNAAVRFPLASGSEIFLESSYQRLEFDPAMEFIPVVVGFRW